MKNLLSIQAIFWGFLLIGCQQQEQKPHKIPGAYHALSQWADQRTYPAETFPKKGFAQAFAQHKAEVRRVAKNSTDHWESIGPHNTAGRMLAIAINPQNSQTLFAGSASGGLWKTTTAGEGINAWQRVSTGFPVLGVSSVAFAPGDSMTIYIGTGEVYNVDAAGTGAAYRNTRGSYGMGILKSIDGGQSWQKSLDWTYDQQRGVNMIKVDPGNSSTVFAGTTEGLYKSTDAGENWEKVLEVVMVTDIIVSKDNSSIIIASCGNFGSEGHGIYRSTNGGIDWQKRTLGLPETYLGKGMLAESFSDPSIMFASIGHGFSGPGATWLCKSDDYGDSWNIVNTTDYSLWQGWFAHDVAIHPEDPNTLILVGIDIHRSGNGGISIAQISEGGVVLATPEVGQPEGESNFSHSDHHDLIFDPANPDIVYFANDGGINKSIDGGYTFYTVNGALQTTQFYAGNSNSATNPDFFMGGLQDNSTVIYRGSKAWTRTIGGDGSWTAINPNDDNIVFGSWQRLNVLRSSNSGLTWDIQLNIPVTDVTSFIAPFVLAPSNPFRIYAGRDRIYTSPDSGDSWNLTNANLPVTGGPALSLTVSDYDERLLYCLMAPYENIASAVRITKNGGQSYINITNGLPDRYFLDLDTDPLNDAIAYVAIGGYGTEHLFKTTDYGAVWRAVGQGLPDLPTNAVIVDPFNSDHIYVGNDIGVYFSENAGETFEVWSEGLPEALLVMDLSISADRKLRIGSHGNGAYQRPLVFDAPTFIEGLTNEVEVFPNPASDFIKISSQRLQSYQIFNLEGQLLLSGPKNASDHINIQQLSKGAYILRVRDESGQMTSTQFMKE